MKDCSLSAPPKKKKLCMDKSSSMNLKCSKSSSYHAGKSYVGTDPAVYQSFVKIWPQKALSKY